MRSREPPSTSLVVAVPARSRATRCSRPGQKISWDEIHVGSRSIFAAAGFTEVSRPTQRRVVMRIDF